MDFELKTLALSRASAEKCDALVVLVHQSVDQASSGTDVLAQMISLALRSGDFEAKAGKLLSAYRPGGFLATRLMLVGAGDGGAKGVRSAVAGALAALKNTNAKRVLVCLGALPELTNDTLKVAVTACSDAVYVYNTTKPKAVCSAIERVIFAVPNAMSVKSGFDKGTALSRGIELAKEWGNRPANHATPTLLAGAAKALGKLPGIKTQILGPKDVAKLGMGSFLAVAQGAHEPLRFIVLKYQGAPQSSAPIVLVGKGITFDTGGISIKPAAEMDEMKYDMCGAASVLGTFKALADLQPAINVVGLIPACENMPDGRAIKPGDVVTSMSGQTIEILNTDAEGRLVLCDALTYAERFKPQAVIDIATLTGACVVALGGVRSGLFTADDAMAAALMQASESSGDTCWRMPLDEDYAEGLKSNFADVANIAGRAGGAVTAAKFLQRFTGKFAWAHLDIAGTAWKSGAAKGSTGRPVALLVEYLLGCAANKADSKEPSVKARSVKSRASAKVIAA